MLLKHNPPLPIDTASRYAICMSDRGATSKKSCSRGQSAQTTHTVGGDLFTTTTYEPVLAAAYRDCSLRFWNIRVRPAPPPSLLGPLFRCTLHYSLFIILIIYSFSFNLFLVFN